MISKVFNLKAMAAILGLPLLVVSFQNCSDLGLRDDVIYSESLASLSSELDAKYLNKLLTTEDLVYWHAQEAGDKIAKNLILAKGMSVAIALEKSTQGVVFQMNSGASTEEGRIQVQNGRIIAVRFSNGSNYSLYDVPVPTSGQDMVIAATFGEKAADFILMVNGIIQTTPVTKVGTPLDFSYIAKTITTGVLSQQIFETMVYQTPLSGAEINVISRHVAGNQGIDGVIVDPSLLIRTAPDSAGSDPLFLAAKSVIEGKCLNCHNSGSTYGVFANMTASSAVSRGFVVPGSPTASPLYFRLIGSSGGGTKNMPQGGSISAAEVQIVADWISSIK